MALPDVTMRAARAMDRSAPPHYRPPHRRAWGMGRSPELRTSGALLGALFVTIAGLHVTLQGVAWWFALAGICLLLLGSAALVRRAVAGRPLPAGQAASRHLLPTAVSGIVLVLVLTVIFAPSTAILGVIPTAQSVDAVKQLVEAAHVSIAGQSLPAVVITPIMFLLCLGVGSLAISADLLANALRTPALAGIPLLVLLAVPSVISINSTDPIIFVLAVLCYLLLLRAPGAPGVARQTGLMIGLSAVVLIGTLVAPLVLPAVTPPQNAGGIAGSSGVNPVLSLGQNLRQDVEHTVLRYSSNSGIPQYLRLVSLQNFSGSQWAPDAFRHRSGNNPVAIGAPPGLAADVATREEQISVTVDWLTSPWLPLPYPTSSVRGLSDDWSWDPDGLVVKNSHGDASFVTYQATSLITDPTPAQLANAGTTVPARFARFLALPARMPKIIVEKANRVAGGATSNYEKALLLQRFFRNGDFQYSETAPVTQGYDGTGMAVIASFLRAKSGYCIHFASAMAVMARTLGIPSRIAVGFLPGVKGPEQVDGRSSFTVSSHDLHAWPELYFEGIGWTRFEPTVSRGDVPAYADTASPDVPSPFNTATPDRAPSAVPRPAASAAPLASEQSNNPVRTAHRIIPVGEWWWLMLAILIAGVLLLTPAASRSLLRVRRLGTLSRGGASAYAAWREVLDTATDLGVPVHRSGLATPRELAEVLAQAIGGAERDPIDRVRAAVERESYGGAVVVPRDGAVLTSTAPLAVDVSRIVADLRAAAGRRQRLRAWLIPASLLARVRRSA